MKKVLFLVNHDVVIYNFRYELVEALRNEGHEVFISSPKGERIKLLQDIGCKFIETPVNRHGINPITDLKLLITYVKMIKEIKPDMVFAYTIKPNIYGGMACALTNTPYVVNITGLGTAVENDGFLQKISVLLYKLAFSKVQKVFFQNEENREFFIKKKIAVKKHGLIPGSGVNLKKFGYADYPESDKVEFAFISRIMKEKGVDQYLDTAKAIKAEFPNTEFHVCGFCEEAYEETLKSLHRQGIINYHGMVSDVHGVIKNMHCIIHPTYYPEGISNVLLESCATGRPIITTDRSGCREVVDNGVNGFVVKQKDSSDLIEKVRAFMNLSCEERKEMGLAGRRKVEKEFDRQIVVDAYLAELHKHYKKDAIGNAEVKIGERV